MVDHDKLDVLQQKLSDIEAELKLLLAKNDTLTQRLTNVHRELRAMQQDLM
jgi:hypothetical protein